MRTVLDLLALAGWQRDQEQWTVRCHTADGRRARLVATLDAGGVRITASTPGPWTLTPLELGRLRGALAEAVITYAQLAPVDVLRPRAGAA
jgi:hypothetical protein